MTTSRLSHLHVKVYSHYFKLHRSYSISFNLANLFFGTVSVYSYLSLEKESDNFCVVFIYSIKQACEIGTFHVVVVQRRQINVQNSVHGTCKFVVCQRKHYYFLPFSLPSPSSLVLLSCRNGASMVT